MSLLGNPVPAVSWRTSAEKDSLIEALAGRIAEWESDLMGCREGGEIRRSAEDAAVQDWLARLAVPDGVDPAVDRWRQIARRNETKDANTSG